MVPEGLYTSDANVVLPLRQETQHMTTNTNPLKDAQKTIIGLGAVDPEALGEIARLALSEYIRWNRRNVTRDQLLDLDTGLDVLHAITKLGVRE